MGLLVANCKTSRAVKHAPFDGRPFRLAMGLRPLDLDTWLEFDQDSADQLSRKAQLIEQRRGDVLMIDAESRHAVDELAGLVYEFVESRERRWVVDDEPLVSVALSISEDVCIMERRDGAWTLTAASVCFPSRWQLAEKFLTSLDEIHDPVPGYEESLGRPTRMFFDRLTPEKSFWRLNWTLIDDEALFQPQRVLGDEVNLDEWVLRVERQTVRSLPSSGAAVFTIRTRQRRVSELVPEMPGVLNDILLALDTAPPATRAYKGWAGLAERWRRQYQLD